LGQFSLAPVRFAHLALNGAPSAPYELKVFAASVNFPMVRNYRTRRFTRGKAPRAPSSETFSFAAFASLREIFRISGGGSAALGFTVSRVELIMRGRRRAILLRLDLDGALPYGRS
jgi:hypothetical protein